MVAPAVLGLLAPLAVNASELNLSEVSNYSNKSAKKTTTTNQFSDILPDDWAYKSLISISESYSCIDNNYAQSLKSGLPLTRYEAAALLNACLDNGLILNKTLGLEVARLTEEFGAEMAILKGQKDGLQSQQRGINAGSFASTTVFNGSTTFLLGTLNYGQPPANDQGEALNMKYAFDLEMASSFTGKDMLYAGFETGNAAITDEIQTSGTVWGDDSIKLHSLFYSFPVGDFSIAVGPLLDQDDLAPTTTSTYSNSLFFDGFYIGPNAVSLHGVGGFPGIAVAYTNDNGWNAGIAYISEGGPGSDRGIATAESADNVTLMAGYDSDNWGGGLIYSWMDNPESTFESATGQTLDNVSFSEGPSVIGIGGYWQTNERFDISLGIDIIDLGVTNSEKATTWSIGADYKWGVGTLSAGIANVPGWNLTDYKYDNVGTSYEIYYDYPVNDALSIKPGIMINTHEAPDWIDWNAYVVEATWKF